MNYAAIINNTDRVLSIVEKTPRIIAQLDDTICTTIDSTYLFCHSVYEFLNSEEMQSWYRLLGSIVSLVKAIALYLILTAEDLFSDPRQKSPVIGEVVIPIIYPKTIAKKPRKPRTTVKKPVMEEGIPVENVAPKKRTRKAKVDNQAT